MSISVGEQPMKHFTAMGPELHNITFLSPWLSFSSFSLLSRHYTTGHGTDVWNLYTTTNEQLLYARLYNFINNQCLICRSSGVVNVTTLLLQPSRLFAESIPSCLPLYSSLMKLILPLIFAAQQQMINVSLGHPTRTHKHHIFHPFAGAYSRGSH